MKKSLDMLEKKYIGQKYSRLTIREIYWNQKGDLRCISLCECGKEKDALLNNVVSARTKSCGCLRNHVHSLEMTGKKFHHLRVLGLSGEKDKHKIHIWNCVCDCGRSVKYTTVDLKKGYKKDCGCRYDIVAYMTKMKFGRLQPVELLKELPHEKWFCQCDCGKTSVVRGAYLRNGHTKSCGCLKEERLASRKSDLTGKKFHRLTVLGKSENHPMDRYIGLAAVSVVQK